jgi:hypothetical protein
MSGLGYEAATDITSIGSARGREAIPRVRYDLRELRVFRRAGHDAATLSPQPRSEERLSHREAAAGDGNGPSCRGVGVAAAQGVAEPQQRAAVDDAKTTVHEQRWTSRAAAPKRILRAATWADAL